MWSLEFPDDYADVDGEDPFYEMRDGGGAILSTGEGRFDLRSYGEGSRVTFTVARDPDARDGWRVTELSRVPFTPRSPPRRCPRSRTSSCGSCRPLHSPRARPSDRSCGQCSSSTWLRAARSACSATRAARSPRSASDPMAGCWRSCPSSLAHWALRARCTGRRSPGEAWLLAVSPWGFELPAVLWRFDGRTGQARQLPAEGLGSVKDLATFEGGIVVGNSWLESNYPWETLVGLDLEGRTIWSVNTEEQNQGLSVDGLGVHESGRCAVVASVFEDLRIFGPGGVPEAVIDLDEVLPAPPNFPSGIRADLDGGWLLYDFQGSPPLWRLTAAGSVLGSLTPHFDDGREEPDLARALRREGDRKLWTSDGVALYQLDDEGAVVRTVGAAPEAAALTEALRIQVDHLGRVLCARPAHGRHPPLRPHRWARGTGHVPGGASPRGLGRERCLRARRRALPRTGRRHDPRVLAGRNPDGGDQARAESPLLPVRARQRLGLP